MAIQNLPRIVTSGSVLMYDITDFHNCYKGEPTTNLLSSPELNAYPTYGNTWGTYSDRLYNGGSYFSIGSITGINNNVITTSLNVSFNTYDVITPQTTGGGVTSGTNYYVNKVSNTTFTLHAYSSSQDGTVGFANLNDVTYDKKISVSSASFPTMWWGPPHLPNSALVKEIIPKGFDVFPYNKTDCIRCHSFRSDGALDYMAYGVTPTLTSGSTYNLSYWLKPVTRSSVGVSGFVEVYFSGNSTATTTGFVLGTQGVWKKYGWSFTCPATGAIYMYFFHNISGSPPHAYDIANIQLEQVNHATAFTTGSRTNTNSIIDLTGNNVISVANASFDSNSELSFGSTGANYLNAGNIGSGFTNYTIDLWFYSTSVVNYRNVFDLNYNTYAGTGNVGPRMEQYSDNTFRIAWSGDTVNNANYTSFNNESISPNQWYNVTKTSTNGTASLYVNGILKQSGVSGSYGYVTSFSDVRVGTGFKFDASRYFVGKIPIFRVYNRDLTPNEIVMNFSGSKRKFGL